jgi:hypothetical protein
MALWGFGAEGSQSAAGANTDASIRRGFRPLPLSEGLCGTDANSTHKRNVVATSAGWVRRTNKTKSEAPTVNIQFDEILVAANPGSGLSYTANTYLGKPDIAEIYVKLNANNVISANVSSNLYVVFNMPVHHRASGNVLTISIANTAGGNHAVARFLSGRANVANNVLVFTLPKLQGRAGSLKATYHVNAQSIGVTGGGNPLYNPEQSVNPTRHSANLVITGATANGLNGGYGARITNFTVSPRGV